MKSPPELGGWSRRAFLRTVSTAIATAALRPVIAFAQRGGAQFFSRQRADHPKRVVVIGAGLAGLTAAYELSLAGHDVTILEARNRAGGRVFTVREFADGLSAECGGEWIDDVHDYVLRYVDEFGLSVEKGSYVDTTEEGLNYSPRSRRTHQLVTGLAKEIDPFGPVPPSLARDDKISFYELLKRFGADPVMLAEMQQSVSDLMAVDIQSISALHMLYELALPASAWSARLVGGNDQLPAALASRLRERIHYSRPVTRIAHGDRGVRVTVLENGSHQVVDAEFLVVAAPFTCVRRIEFVPALSTEKMRAIATLGYGQILKAPLQFRERFWLKGEARRSLHGMAGSVYDASGRQPGPRGLLTVYVPASSGASIAAIATDQRLSKVLAKVVELYPAARSAYEGGYVKWWKEDRWAGGTYAYFRPGEVTGLRPVLGRSEGRIHFAGEHTAGWQGYMNGAIESGHRVAREIHDATVTSVQRASA